MIVGPEKIKFTTHATILCGVSRFFETACSTRWDCGRSRIITLEDHQPPDFAAFLTWALTGNVQKAATFVEFDGYTGDERKAALGRQWTQLARLHILGDYLLSSKFKNMVIDLLLGCQKRYSEEFVVIPGTSPLEVAYVWNRTTATSPLRKIVLEHRICFGLPKASSVNQIHLGFCQQLAEYAIEKYQRGLPRVNPWDLDWCTHYHDHPDRKEGYSCTKK